MFSFYFQGFMTVFMLITSDMHILINYISFSESLFILMSIAALLWLRYKEPNRHRPIKVWLGFPILFFVICLFLVVLPIIQRPIELGVAIGVIIIGIPVYYFAIYREDKPKWFIRFTEKVTFTTQILCAGVPEEKDE